MHIALFTFQSSRWNKPLPILERYHILMRALLTYVHYSERLGDLSCATRIIQDWHTRRRVSPQGRTIPNRSEPLPRTRGSEYGHIVNKSEIDDLP